MQERADALWREGSPAAIRICARRDASTTFVVRTARRQQERGWANNAADLKLNVMAPAQSLCIRGRMGRSSAPVPPMTIAPVRGHSVCRDFDLGNVERVPTKHLLSISDSALELGVPSTVLR